MRFIGIQTYPMNISISIWAIFTNSCLGNGKKFKKRHLCDCGSPKLEGRYQGEIQHLNKMA